MRCGAMAGAGDFVEIGRRARRKRDFLRPILLFRRGIPSHDTLHNVMDALPGRSCRSIENRLHRAMDVVFHDDLMRLRTDHGPANMAAMRHAALNPIRAVPDKACLKVRRKTLGRDEDYLLQTLTQFHP